ncbi:hypothetical protein QAD02_012186 [Eretmocerus hayati]|uniref:Uncharacterized protein n=1 Tax=Eretmocerus hayati TaxID=131215 RepID=A0ACC2P1K8_9HYME|nr:hypothetical protein QAD02_012186 [Eretmocerus hayati]
MARFAVLAALYALAFLTVSSDGTAVSPEGTDLSELTTLNSILSNNVNLPGLMSVSSNKLHPHTNLTITQIIELYGYKSETHEVATDDGYVLQVHRIPGKQTNSRSEGKPVVFLMHGIISSSMQYVIAGPEIGLGFILSDAGYDVWMGNARGNVYSRKHKTLEPQQSKFWDFSWHEIGAVDVRNMIDYALEKSMQKKLYYIGHSQGSTTFFVMLSEHPEYNDKINAMFSLAPVAYSSHMFSPFFQLLARMQNVIGFVTKFIGANEFLPTNEFTKEMSGIICSDESLLQPVCSNALFILAGFDRDQLDTSLLTAFLANFPAGSSVKQFRHYAQLITSGKFRKYDYGWWKNLQEYRSFYPPSYKLDNVKVPVALHYSVNDWVSSVKDVDRLSKDLPNLIGRFRVPNDGFNHLDFVWAKDVKTLLYDKVLNLMKRY